MASNEIEYSKLNLTSVQNSLNDISRISKLYFGAEMLEREPETEILIRFLCFFQGKRIGKKKCQV